MQLFDRLKRPIKIGDRVLALYISHSSVDIIIDTVTDIKKSKVFLDKGTYKY